MNLVNRARQAAGHLGGIHRRAGVVLPLALAFLLVIGGIAFGDQVVNNIDSTVDPTLETRTITAGSSTTVGFFVLASNTVPAGDASGCNATGSNSATMTLSVPGVVTATPSSITFVGCGNTQNVVFSSDTPGSYTISVASMSGGKAGSLWDTAPASFTLIVNPSNTAPVVTVPGPITAEATGPGGAAVSFTASATDAQDGTLTPTCSPASGSTFALGTTTVTCSVTDSGLLSDSKSFTVTVVDTTAPSLSLPADITAEATGPSGAVVSYSASATDLVDGAVTPSCSPASGSTFGLGTTAVNCSATDSSANTGNGSFNVTVQDTTAPSLSLPANTTVTATYMSEATVNFSTSATDLVDGSVPVSCSPASGSKFALGTTTVNCSATDSAGNTANGSFTVTVSYNFTGFFRPVDNLPTWNRVKAGSAIPTKFGLYGYQGMNVLWAGSPSSVKINCDASATLDTIEETVTAGSSSLSYDSATDQYNYVWKTDKAWAGTCRRLTVKLADGSVQTVHFNFTK